MRGRDGLMDHNRGCLCCVHVLRRERPVLLISNVGGMWQLMCGHADHDFDADDADGAAEDAKALRFTVLLDGDASLAAIAELPDDWSARRPSPQAPWQPYYDPD